MHVRVSISVCEGPGGTAVQCRIDTAEQPGQCCIAEEQCHQSETKSRSSMVGYVYDERMLEHRPGRKHPECPQRLVSIHRECQPLLGGCVRVPAVPAALVDLERAHTADHVRAIIAGCKTVQNGKGVHRFDEDTVASRGTLEAALLAAGSTIDLALRIATGGLDSGFAVVRPPGHHACPCTAMGFCFFNSVAAAALRVASELAQRVAVVDWDVHHGNGTVEVLERSEHDVLYISIHLYHYGDFYPGTGNPKHTGEDGSVVNVGWNAQGLGDLAYLAAFDTVVVPVLSEFNPEIIIVSAGFDAARGDPLGGMDVTPEGYAAMTDALLAVCPRVLISLEGGYNLGSIAKSAHAVLARLTGRGSGGRVRTIEAAGSLALADIEATLQALRGTRWEDCASGQLARVTKARYRATQSELGSRSHAKQGGSASHKGSRNASAHIPKGPRRTAEAKWKDDIFKLKRRAHQLESALSRWTKVEKGLARGKKPTKKQLRELGDKEEQQFELLRVQTDLAEIEHLRTDDAIRLYAS